MVHPLRYRGRVGGREGGKEERRERRERRERKGRAAVLYDDSWCFLPSSLPPSAGLLHLGSGWSGPYSRGLFQLFGRSLEHELQPQGDGGREGGRAGEGGGGGEGPSTMLESMVGTVLVFVKECPEVVEKE